MEPPRTQENVLWPSSVRLHRQCLWRISQKHRRCVTYTFLAQVSWKKSVWKNTLEDTSSHNANPWTIFQTLTSIVHLPLIKKCTALTVMRITIRKCVLNREWWKLKYYSQRYIYLQDTLYNTRHAIRERSHRTNCLFSSRNVTIGLIEQMVVPMVDIVFNK